MVKMTAILKSIASHLETIRVLITGDQPLVQRAFSTILSAEPDMSIVGQALLGASGSEALQLVRSLRPDIVLLDMQLPRSGGFHPISRIITECPATRVVVLATLNSDEDEPLFEAISSGAQAFLLKDADEREILNTIRLVMQGGACLAPNMVRKLLDEFRRMRPLRQAPPKEPLTEREACVLELLIEGQSNKEIAAALFLAEGTVKNYVSRIMEKHQARTRTGLAVKALRQSVRTLPDHRLLTGARLI
jgi:DNA-binding NarL/FixJ family response regulator